VASPALYTPKAAWSGSHDRFSNFKSRSIFLEWMMLCCLNVASGLTTTSPTPTIKNPPPPKKGAWSGSHDNFWAVATLFKFCKCIDYGECHTMVKKSLLKMGVVLVM